MGSPWGGRDSREKGSQVYLKDQEKAEFFARAALRMALKRAVSPARIRCSGGERVF